MVESHGREIEISNLNHKEKPKRNTRREFSCRCVARVQVRDSKKRRRYATRADRLVLRQSVRGIESMTPSASLILLTLRFDRQVTASSANADRATKHFRYRNPFFLTNRLPTMTLLPDTATACLLAVMKILLL